MPGLAPGISEGLTFATVASYQPSKDVNARDGPGHDAVVPLTSLAGP